MTSKVPPEGLLFSRSQSHFERAREILPRGVTSSMRADVRPVPLAFARAQGSRLWDIDGNEYRDFVGAFGPAFLGHNPPFVVDAVQRQLNQGVTFGGQHPGEVDLAERIVSLVPCAEVVSLCNSGTEAVQTALRVARAGTGRQKILRFAGQYHGWMDPLGPPASPGASEAAQLDVVEVAWNDTFAFEQVMDQIGPTLAAVIMEAIACNHGALRPDPGYLELVRDLCDKYGAILIFDEVITGFRIMAGGAQEYLGVTPDIGVYAKALGSGFPLAAIAGRREAMKVAMDGGPLRLAGTYNGQALGVAAGIATLAYLEANCDSLYDQLELVCHRLETGLRSMFEEMRVPITLNRVGSVLQLFYGLARPPRNYSEAQRSDSAALARVSELILRRGVYCLPRGLWFVSASHSEADIDFTLNAVRGAVIEFCAER